MDTASPPLVWVLTDDKPGNRTQSIGVAQKLPWAFEEKHIRLTRLAKLPNQLLGATRATVSRSGSDAITAPWPDIVIAAGRRLVPLLRWIKKQSPRCFIVYLMEPQTALDEFDLLAIPEHDRPKPRANLMATLGAAHALTPEKLAEATARWAPELESLNKPRIALLVGGYSASARYTLEDMHDCGNLASELALQAGGSLMVTTSRRTGNRPTDYLRLALIAEHQLFQWSPEWQAAENPYLGFLALADAVVVTGDSMSMCAEACSLGKPVFIFIPRHGELAPKLRAFHQSLFERKLAQPLTAGVSLNWQPGTALDEAGRVAAEVVERYSALSTA